jgi:hypothetical protein
MPEKRTAALRWKRRLANGAMLWLLFLVPVLGGLALGELLYPNDLKKVGAALLGALSLPVLAAIGAVLDVVTGGEKSDRPSLISRIFSHLFGVD